MLAGLREGLNYIQRFDPKAHYVGHGKQANGLPLPHLTSPTCKHFPTDYGSSRQYFQCNNTWELAKDPLTQRALKSRLERQRDGTSSKKRSSKKDDKGATEIYVDVCLGSQIEDVEMIINSMNVDLRRKNISARVRDMQCWKSSSKKMLVCIKNDLCVHGTLTLLRHLLKEAERKLCRHGRLKLEDYYDLELPDMHLTLRAMREIQIPDEEKQRTKEILNFKGFAPEYRKAFFIETSPLGHARINPLLAFLVESKMIDAFGPFATVMDVPLGNPSIYTSITHMRTARVSCGYNLSTMTLETSDVLTWDYQVKVKMREVEEIDKTGNKTGKVVRPLPAHKITTLRKELQRILCGGSQIFHTAVINESGPDKGISRVVVEYDPDDPRCDDKLAFAKQTVGTLA